MYFSKYQNRTCAGSQAMSLTPLPVSPSLTVPMGCFCDMLNTLLTGVLELWKGEKEINSSTWAWDIPEQG